MSKKILMSLAPLLAVAAFAISPAAASAFEYGTCGTVGAHTANCPGTEHFTPFAAVTKVVSFSKQGNVFILENEAKTADIECKGLFNRGTVENVAGVGKSSLKLVFFECTGSGALAACEINPPSGAITGNVSDKVLTATTVEVTILNGFNVKCVEGAITTELGNVTGSVIGTQTSKTVPLKFAKTPGLKFLGVNATITGEDELFTEAAKPLGVYI